MLILFSIFYIYNNNNIYIFNSLLSIVIIFVFFEYKYNIFFLKNIILLNFIANTTLINGVVLIHPLLIYLTYTLLIIFIIYYKYNFIFFNKILIRIKLHKNILFIFSFIALFLGGW